jgi:A/G-specific adenine glycosylase
MLQQTTVGTVLNHFEKFIKIFPTLKSLATSNEEQLVIAWKGLGYYRRARNLLKAAQIINQDYQGSFPEIKNELLTIPGIGEYTASALMAIGHNQKDLAVDANLERVLARYYGFLEIKGVKLQKKIRSEFSANTILANVSKNSFRDLNEALMDVGRVLCQSRKASCELCPLKKECVAYRQKNPLQYPKMGDEAKSAKKIDHQIKLSRYIVFDKSGKKILGYQKKKGEWLEGQWELPTSLTQSTDKKLTQYPRLKIKSGKKLFELKSGITKYQIVNHVYMLDYKTFSEYQPDRKFVFRQIDHAHANLTSTSEKIIKMWRNKNVTHPVTL